MTTPDLEKLIAAEEIRDLMARYVRFADTKQWDRLAALFLADASFIPRKVDGSIWLQMSGRDEIARTIETSVGTAQPIHHLFSYELEFQSATSVRGVWSMEDWIIASGDGSHKPNSPAGAFQTMHGFGHYHASYQKFDGTWFIAALEQTRIKLDFT
jgi:hypothetical protein